MTQFKGDFSYHFNGIPVSLQELSDRLTNNNSVEFKVIGLDVFYTEKVKVEKVKNWFPVTETGDFETDFEEAFKQVSQRVLAEQDSEFWEGYFSNHTFEKEVDVRDVKQQEERPEQVKGVKHNQGKLPINTMITVQFPKAIKAITQATLFGHEKYKEVDKDWLNFKRVDGGSQTYADASERHGFDKHTLDSESGLPHIFHKAWNAVAELELWIEENNL